MMNVKVYYSVGKALVRNGYPPRTRRVNGVEKWREVCIQRYPIHKYEIQMGHSIQRNKSSLLGNSRAIKLFSSKKYYVTP